MKKTSNKKFTTIVISTILLFAYSIKAMQIEDNFRLHSQSNIRKIIDKKQHTKKHPVTTVLQAKNICFYYYIINKHKSIIYTADIKFGNDTEVPTYTLIAASRINPKKLSSTNKTFSWNLFPSSENIGTPFSHNLNIFSEIANPEKINIVMELLFQLMPISHQWLKQQSNFVHQDAYDLLRILHHFDNINDFYK